MIKTAFFSLLKHIFIIYLSHIIGVIIGLAMSITTLYILFRYLKVICLT